MLLEQVKIYHPSPELAANFLNQIVENPSLWWNSKLVQDARECFCKTYALTSTHPLKDWAKILIDMQKIS